MNKKYFAYAGAAVFAALLLVFGFHPNTIPPEPLFIANLF